MKAWNYNGSSLRRPGVPPLSSEKCPVSLSLNQKDEQVFLQPCIHDGVHLISHQGHMILLQHLTRQRTSRNTMTNVSLAVTHVISSSFIWPHHSAHHIVSNGTSTSIANIAPKAHTTTSRMQELKRQMEHFLIICTPITFFETMKSAMDPGLNHYSPLQAEQISF